MVTYNFIDWDSSFRICSHLGCIHNALHIDSPSLILTGNWETVVGSRSSSWFLLSMMHLLSRWADRSLESKDFKLERIFLPSFLLEGEKRGPQSSNDWPQAIKLARWDKNDVVTLPWLPAWCLCVLIHVVTSLWGCSCCSSLPCKESGA